ncbi:MAG: response regulator transcription factor [Chthoniobacterales bacterium]|nr:response regulator transcription factor [Chthoniobacterales bacterium]
MNKVRIFIADDHELLRAGLRRLVESRPDWEVSGEAADGTQVVQMVLEQKPDVLILDLAMPGANGLAIAAELTKTSPAVQVLIYTGDDDPNLIYGAFEAGAKSFIRKTDDRAQLTSAIEALGRRKPYLTPEVAEILLAAQFRAEKTQELTAREREIVRLLCEGKSNQETATLLEISTRTVEVHRAAVMRKLQLDAFADLVRYAVRHKIVKL